MYCRHCGKQVNNDSKFCPECGGSFNSNKSELFNESNNSDTNTKKWHQKKWNEMNSDDKKKVGAIYVVSSVVIILSLIFIFWDFGGGASNNKKLEIIGTPIMTVEYNEYLGYSVSIKGQAKNNGNTTSYVSVTFNLYNASGHIIGSVMDNHNTLGNGAIWNFNATVGYYGNERPTRFELADITRF